MWQTYVLALDSGKYYVGRSKQLSTRLRQHFTLSGAKFTKKHMSDRARVVHVRDGDWERELTLQLMGRFGHENVRGGPWCRDVIGEPMELWARSTDEQNVLGEHKLTMTSVTTLANTSLSQWAIGPAQKNKHGQNEYHIVLKGTRQHPRVQPVSTSLPLRVPFGISAYNDTGTPSINFCVAPYQQDVKAFFMALDRWLLEWAWDNRVSIFSKPPASKEVLESMYTPLLQPAKAEYDPLLRAKCSENIPVWISTDNGKVKGSTASVTPGSTCVPVLSVEKVWLMAGRFGCTMRCQALICTPRKEASLDDLFCMEPDTFITDANMIPCPAG